MKNIKTYLFSYSYDGSEYSLEIPASSAQEAIERLSRLPFARYDGELVATVPVIPLAGILIKLYTWAKNMVQ